MGCLVERGAAPTFSVADGAVIGVVVDAGSGVGPFTDQPSIGDTGVQPGVNGQQLGAVIGETRTLAVAPPSISGGTLLVTADGHTAVAADPDRDRVWFVDLATRALLGGVALEPGDEPGRVVADASGRVHVALRRGGAVVTLDLATRAIVARRAVCAAPRGIAFDAAAGALHVACAGGELVTLPVAGGAPTRTLHLERDLRDVLVQGDTLLVTRFREAEMLTVAADGTVARRVRPAVAPEGADGGLGVGGTPGVAWRAVAGRGGVVMLHQRAQTLPVSVGAGAYGISGRSRCEAGVVQSTVSVIGPEAPAALPSLNRVVLGVDLALSPDGDSVAIAAPGNAAFPELGQVFVFVLSQLAPGQLAVCARGETLSITGQAVAVAYAPDGAVVVQTREPATLQIPRLGVTVTLSAESREDTGHRLFHSNAGAFLACASCHPEGGDDGHVWIFDPIGPRRTQAFRGGLTGTAPFHWDGDMASFTTLVQEVFGRRMNGGSLTTEQITALERWGDAQRVPSASPPGDAPAVTRGRALFNDPTVGCATCHGGPRLTNNTTVNVGTGGAFQVPALVGVAWRTPLMHNGCAATLRDRFGACGGGDSHGHTSQLAPAQIDDLVAYLETL
jgi:DNA-binding beta-propeller fold protein YncE